MAKRKKRAAVPALGAELTLALLPRAALARDGGYPPSEIVVPM
jgi:hypothetical protein